MDRPTDITVAGVVSQFFERRKSGERVSIDDVLATADLPDPARVRAEVIGKIARESAVRFSRSDRLSASETIGPNPGADSSGDPWADLPEIEGYDLIDVLGRGGMGIVYEAYQQSTGRRVAIKFMLGAAAATEAGRRRFEREVELIARLQHPGVVSIIDSGVHRRRWFYVMEFVDGVPLDDAIKPGVCDLRDALDLVARIADAADYAHQRGVLHRDLKPSNIIIDSRGEPRLLDFGLAKDIDPVTGASAGAVGGIALDASLSEPGQILGTLAFMPPEQSRGRADQISVRTDVYSLGAIAYELITGRLPCAMDGTLSDILRRIEEIDPPAPSSIRPGVSRDADAVLLKSLEKDPQRRYASAGELAADLRRCVRDEPVHARRVGPAVKAVRWLRRNRLAARVGAVALSLVLIISILATVNIVRASRARLDHAQLQQQTTDWLSQTLAQLSPDSGYFNQTLTLEQQNDAHANRLASDPPGRPEVAASVHSFVGRNYLQLRLFEKAERQHRAAVEILRRVHRGADPALAESIHSLAATLWWKGEYTDAEPLYREALAMRLSLFGAESLETADTTNHLAACLDRLGRDEESERHYREALRIRRLLLTGDTPAQEPIAASLNNLGAFHLSRGEPASAEPYFRESLALIESIRGADDHRVGAVLTNLSECLIELGAPADAEPLLRRAADIYTRRLGENNASTATAIYELARSRAAQGATDDALYLINRALDIRRETLPAGHPLIGDALTILGRTHLMRGERTNAAPPLREALSLRRAATPRSVTAIAQVSSALAAAIHDTAADEAEALIDDAVELLRPRVAAGDTRAVAAVRACIAALRQAGAAELADRLNDLQSVPGDV